MTSSNENEDGSQNSNAKPRNRMRYSEVQVDEDDEEDEAANKYQFAFTSVHEPALGFEPTADLNMLASFRDQSGKHDMFVVRRPTYTENQLNERYESEKTESMEDKVSAILDKMKCSKERAKAIALSYVPIVETVKRYDFRKMLLVDTICGITIGLVNIAQGLTHGLLTNIAPVIGLYSSFFPILMYSVFGTSRVLAFGTVSITSILVGNSVLDISTPYISAISNTTSKQAQDAESMKIRSDLAICITFFAGLIQMVAGVLRLGLVTIYFSDAMVAGFTTATMIHVMTSQAKNVLGVQFPRPTGNGNVIMSWIEIFRNIGDTNLATLLLSLACAAILLLSKYLVNPYLLKKIYAPLPTEAIIVICSTFLSDGINLQENYGVSVVGAMNNGLPTPAVPNMKYATDVLVASLTCALINYAVTVSLAQVLAKKNNEEVDPNQECFAYGICNFASSFFFCMPTGGSVSRTYIQDSMHCKSQIVGVVQSILMLVVLLWLTSFFSNLPQCVLAVIIIVALTAIGEHFKHARQLWSISRLDCLIWIISFVSTVGLDIQIGLVISIITSSFFVVIRGQLVHSAILGNLPGTDLYRDVATYKHAEEIPGVKIFRFDGSLYFACTSIFRDSLYAKTGVNPQLAKVKAAAAHKQDESTPLIYSSNPDPSPIKFIILDMSVCSFVDYDGIRVLQQVISEYQAIGITVILASCIKKLRRSLQAAGFFSPNEPGLAYVSVHDAIIYAQTSLRSTN